MGAQKGKEEGPGEGGERREGGGEEKENGGSKGRRDAPLPTLASVYGGSWKNFSLFCVKADTDST